MKPERFQPRQHHEEICQWAEARGMMRPPLELLPLTGRVISGVCAVFLYRTDSSVGFIENLISNPGVEASIASNALDACVRAIEEDARASGVRFLWGSTYIPGVAERAQRAGFNVAPNRYKLLTKRLEV